MMTLWLILGVSLAVVGGIVIFLLQMPEPVEKKMKKRDLPPPEPVKDWKAISERVEKRLKSVEASFHSAQDEVKLRDKRIADLQAESVNIKKQFDQEKVWRLKEEAEVEKEKKHERIIQIELQKTREEVAREATNRIKQEAELKEFRQVREEQATQVRKLTALSADLDRKLTEAVKELKVLREDNAELRKKKEDEEWVSKTDYRKLEAYLKRARWEVEQFKRKISQAEWPKALQPKPAASAGDSVSLAGDGTKPPEAQMSPVAPIAQTASPVAGPEAQISEASGVASPEGSAPSSGS